MKKTLQLLSKLSQQTRKAKEIKLIVSNKSKQTRKAKAVSTKSGKEAEVTEGQSPATLLST